MANMALTFQDLVKNKHFYWRHRRALVVGRDTSNIDPSRHFVTVVVAGGIRMRLTRGAVQNGSEEVHACEASAEEVSS